MTRALRRTQAVVTAPLVAAACVLMACVLAVALVAIGPTLVVLAPWDIFIDLDEAWRLHNGQVPHTDFHTPVGPLRFLLISVGMSLIGPQLNAVVVSNAIFLVIAVTLAVFVAFRRLSRLPAAAFVVFIMLMSGAARHIGRSPDLPGYIEFYNRFGWALICIVSLQLFFPRRRNLIRLPLIEGVVMGATIAALFYMKITYAVVALVALAVACWRDPQLRNSRMLGAAAGAAALVATAMWVSTGVSLLAYLGDISDAARAQTLSRRLGSARSTLKKGAPFVALTLGTWVALVGVPAHRREIPWRTAVGSGGIFAFLVASGVLVAFWNTGEGAEIPLLVVAGMWVLAEHGRRSSVEERTVQERANRPRHDIRLLIAMSSVIVTGSWIAFQDAASIALTATGREYRVSGAPSAQRFNAAPLADYVIPSNVDWVTEIWRSAQLPGRINDGLALLRSHITTDDSVMTVGFSNVFPYALGTRPPRGVPVFLDLDNNLSELRHPDPDSLFADVDFVVIPIIRSDEAHQGGADKVGALLGIYRPYLNTHYGEVARSEYWILLGRQ